MQSYADDLSKKKVEALRALTDAPPWFERIIREAEKEKSKVEKGNVIWTHCFCHEERLEVTKRNSVHFENTFTKIYILGFSLSITYGSDRFSRKNTNEMRWTEVGIQS